MQPIKEHISFARTVCIGFHTAHQQETSTMSAGAAVEQYQFKVPFIIYRDLKSILKPVDEQYMEKMNQMTIEQKGKTPYTEKISTHVPPACKYTVPLLMEMFRIHWKCPRVATVWKSLKITLKMR